MENNQICIWGCRDGFEIIYSENEAWKSYLLNNTKEIDQKFQKLIEGHRKDFYYLSKINGFQVFSYVTHENIDIEARTTYMVISLISKSGVSYGSELMGVLRNIWNHYQSKNITETAHLTSEEFSISELRNQADSLKPIASNYGYEQNNCVITIDDETLFQNEFGKFKGDTAYFIYPNSEASVLNRLPQTIYSLKNLVSNKPNTHDLVQLKNCIHTKTNLPQAKSLYEKLQQWLSPQEQNRYADWNREEEIKKQPAEPKAPIPAPIPAPNPTPVPAPNPTPNPPDDKQELEVIKSLISGAKANQWKTDLSSIKILLDKNIKLQARLSSSEINDLKEWEKTFDTAEEIECGRLLTQLYQKIKKASKNEIKINVTTLKAEVTSLENRISSLNNKVPKANLRSLEAFIYLSSKAWIPKNRKPLYLKLAATFLILALTVAGYFSYKNWHVNYLLKLAEETADYDHDGMENKVDQEDRTIWLKDTTKYKLVKYVDHLGKVDAKKTKPLCDCWEFSKIADRAILLCKDNKNWFKYENNLHEFREDSPGDGRFYKNNVTRVATSDDDKIEQYHQKLFPEAYGENPVPDPVVVSGYSNIDYKEKRYSIKSDFLSNEGAFYNDARWKFRNNKFQKRECIPNTQNGRGAWNNASNNDIDVILQRFGELINTPVNPPVQTPRTGTTTVPTTNLEVDTENDKYWIKINTDFNNYDTEEYTIIKGNYTNKKPTSSKGKKALKDVKSKINSLEEL